MYSLVALFLVGIKSLQLRAMVVDQLVEQLIPAPEVRGSNPVISKFYVKHCLLSTLLKRRN